MTPQLEWMLITANPEIAQYAQESGVHRIFVDMETLGKAERQGHLDTHKASHSLDDVAVVRKVLSTSELMVRVNPLHPGTQNEVSGAVALGADRLMLPMFRTREEVERFRRIVPPTTPITFLAETPAALARTADWADRLTDGDEVHFGLNDLSLAMGLDFPFEPLAANLFESAATLLSQKGIPFGIGGVARAGTGELPTDVILGEHIRLRSSRAILSRSFHGSADTLAELKAHLDLASELAELRQIEARWREASRARLTTNNRILAKRCFELADLRRQRA